MHEDQKGDKFILKMAYSHLVRDSFVVFAQPTDAAHKIRAIFYRFFCVFSYSSFAEQK